MRSLLPLPERCCPLLLLLGAAALLPLAPVRGCQAPGGRACLRVGAFNVRTFGSSKMSNDTVAAIIAQVVQRYDILVLQEIRDKNFESPRKLLDLLNRAGGNYSLVLSDRLGRSRTKEQYGFYYRQDRVQAAQQLQYDEGEEDPFEREPFSVLFQLPPSQQRQGQSFRFAVVALHAKPSAAVPEIKALDTVTKDAMAVFRTENVLIMGDLNADCVYSSSRRLAGSAIVSSRYTWLIDSQADTTVKDTTDCAYDRIIATTSMMSAVHNGTASVFKFDDNLRLSADMALAVSDHYPVEVELHIPARSTQDSPTSGAPRFFRSIPCSLFHIGLYLLNKASLL